MAELEGFICPLCRQDLLSFQDLEAHFREKHDESGGSKIKNNFMSFLDKAKNTLRIDRNVSSKRDSLSPGSAQGVEDGASAVAGGGRDGRGSRDEPVTNVSGIDTALWPQQEFGEFRDYTSTYKKYRDDYLKDVVVETNRLVIRLEKLFRLLKDSTPKTSKQMKALEQNVIHWKKDDEEKRCRGCGRGFGVRRRRHHCRLCGGIMCKQCSQFMTLGETYPVLYDCPDYHSLAPSPSLHRRRLLITSKQSSANKRGREGEGEDGDDEPTDEIRMCAMCRKLIHRRLIRLQSLEMPLVAALYDKMQLTMQESERLRLPYQDMADSLWSGEHGHTLHNVTSKRRELLRLYESIDSISKQVLSMSATDSSTRSQKLYRSIRVYASNYLQENLLTLTSLPTTTKLREIKEQREREAQERLKELERDREARKLQELSPHGAGVGRTMQKNASGDSDGLSAMDKFGMEVRDKFLDFSKDIQSKVGSIGFKKDSESLSMNLPPSSASKADSGWMCTSVSVPAHEDVSDVEDPFEMQRKQLLSYISQARRANRLDEVTALEQSLRDIENAMQERPLTYGFSPKK